MKMNAEHYNRLVEISQLQNPGEKLQEFLKEVEPESYRTSQQNRSLHKLFQETADLCEEKGVEMRDLVKEEIPIPVTKENLKLLWKKIQHKMFGKKSTAELKKTGEIDEVYDALNRILIERTNGEVSLPPFPHVEEETYLNAPEVEVPENTKGQPKF